MVIKRKIKSVKKEKVDNQDTSPKKKKRIIQANIRRPGVEQRVRRTKRNVLRALEATGGIVSPACKAAGLGNANNFYAWYKNDPAFKERVDAIREEDLDFTESQLKKLIKAMEPSAIYFALKCLGKKRGYVEKSQVDFNDISEPQKLKIGDNEIVFY